MEQKRDARKIRLRFSMHKIIKLKGGSKPPFLLQQSHELKIVPSTGIEPVSPPSEGGIVSIQLRGRLTNYFVNNSADKYNN